MISTKTKDVDWSADVSEMSDESLSDALNEIVQKYNLYSSEQRKRKRVKYEMARKEYEVASKKLSDFCDLDKTFEMALFRPTLSRFFN
jgi:hypothetical protein